MEPSPEPPITGRLPARYTPPVLSTATAVPNVFLPKKVAYWSELAPARLVLILARNASKKSVGVNALVNAFGVPGKPKPLAETEPARYAFPLLSTATALDCAK